MDNKLLQPGTMLRGGTYRVERQLSSGGFGNTYVVTNVNFDETYAMKEFYMKDINLRDGNTVTVSVPDNKATFDTQRNKFMKEAQRLRKLKNEHIVGVHDLFEENGTTYYIMDFIDGESLGERLKRTGQPLQEAEVRNILSQVVDALEAVHQQGIRHLDLKPANIMIDRQGKALLIDFGASKQMRAGEGLTTTSGLCYTPGYAPIEQIEQSLDKFGPWTDIYSLGATTYRLLTLKQLPSPMELVEEGSAALQFPPTVSPSMQQLVQKMMQPNRKNRPQSMDEVRQLLAGKSVTPTETTIATPPPVKNEETKVIDTPKLAATVTPPATPTSDPPSKSRSPLNTQRSKSQAQSSTLKAQRSKPVWPFIAAGAAVVALLIGGGLIAAVLFMSGSKDEPAIAKTDSVENVVATDEPVAALTPAPEEPVKPTEPTKPNRDEPQPTTANKPNEPNEPQPATTTQQKMEPTTSSTSNTSVASADNTIYDVVELAPSFRNGDVRVWIANNVQYPPIAVENGISGRVVVGFVVEKDGSISHVQVLRGVDPSLDKEAVRVVKSMPKWNPGMQKGIPVRVKFNIPISFKL
ncbi:MAG: TonB family protein [Prevotella sp.]|nr:TonB family protein [Prevotella sp.]